MNRSYLFTALDIAAYMKWCHIHQQDELDVLNRLWTIRKCCLDVPRSIRFKAFCNIVYDELYELWKRGFVSEASDISLALDPENYPQPVANKTYAKVEMYLKLLALHFILTPRLPYTLVELKREFHRIGYKTISRRLASVTLKAVERLGMVMVKDNGFPCDEDYIMAGGLVMIGLSSERVKQLAELDENKETPVTLPKPGPKETAATPLRPTYNDKPAHQRPVAIEDLDDKSHIEVKIIGKD